MILDILESGGKFTGYGEYEQGIDPALMPCPFCGSSDLVINNTGPPAYTVECQECGCELHTAPDEVWDTITTKRACKTAHRVAFDLAIQKWNIRDRGAMFSTEETAAMAPGCPYCGQ